jgi:uncharacterized protein
MTANSDPPIDRLAPAQRPDRRVVMYQSWRSLLFLHWEVDPDALRPGLPAGLELDTFEGRAYVGLVPFTMLGIRPRFLPAVPWFSNFHETNVRTYVHVGGENPGVWFYSLDAANPVAVALARSLFHLNYFNARMSLDHGDDGTIRYRSTRRTPQTACPMTDVHARPTGTPSPAQPGTLDHFLLERYLLYSRSPRRLFRGQVHHSPYPVQGAEVLGLDESLLAAAGLKRPATAPLAHYAAGIDVEIFGLESVPAS